MAARKKSKDDSQPQTLAEAAQIAAREEFKAPVHITKRYLPCTLTSEELILLGEKLVQRERDIERNDTEKKAKVKAFGEKHRALKGEIISIGELIETKTEERSVEVGWYIDVEALWMRCVRNDTGVEIRGRALTESERELVLRANGRDLLKDILSREPLPGTYEDGDEEPVEDRQIPLPLAAGDTTSTDTPSVTDAKALDWTGDDKPEDQDSAGDDSDG